jgi:hypothetical protein
MDPRNFIESIYSNIENINKHISIISFIKIFLLGVALKNHLTKTKT